MSVRTAFCFTTAVFEQLSLLADIDYGDYTGTDDPDSIFSYDDWLFDLLEDSKRTPEASV